MGLLFPGKKCYTIFMANQLARPGNRRPHPAASGRCRCRRGPALHRILHRQHPQPQHPASLCSGRFELLPLVRGAGADRARAPRARARRRLRRAAGDVARGALASSSTWRRCACCSTGWWSARWSDQPRLRGAGPEPHRQARQDADPLAGGSASAVREHPHRQPGRPSRSGADRRPDLQLRAHQRGARDAGRGLLPPGQALVAPAAREGRQEPRDAGAPHASRRTSTSTFGRPGSARTKRGRFFGLRSPKTAVSPSVPWIAAMPWR